MMQITPEDGRDFVDDLSFASCAVASWMFVLAGIYDHFHWIPNPGREVVFSSAIVSVITAAIVGQLQQTSTLVRLWLAASLVGVAAHLWPLPWPITQAPWEIRMDVSCVHLIALGSTVGAFGLLVQTVPTPAWLHLARSGWGRRLLFYGSFVTLVMLARAYCSGAGMEEFRRDGPPPLVNSMFLLLAMAAFPAHPGTRRRERSVAHAATNMKCGGAKIRFGWANAMDVGLRAVLFLVFLYLPDNAWRSICDECSKGP